MKNALFEDAPSHSQGISLRRRVISQKLMIRAGMIRKVGAGVYNLLPMGLRAVRKVEAIVRDEMNRAGAQEVSMPMVIPAELWHESGRWDEYGKELLRIKDRHDRWNFASGPLTRR